MEEIARHTPSADWATALIVACLMLLALAKLLNSSRFNEFIQLVITNKYFFMQGKEKNVFSAFNMILFAVQAISVSLFLFLAAGAFFPERIAQDEFLFVKIVSGYVLFVLFKLLAEKIIAAVFSITGIIDDYLYQKLSYRNLLSLLILFANVLLIYTFPESRFIIISVAGIVLFANVAMLLYTFKSNEKTITHNLFYFILYLCALEISPYFILYKAVA